MALLHVSFFSKTLMRTIPLSVYLPSDAVDFQNQYISEGPYKTLILLHGVMGSEQDWVNQTRILRYAKEKNLALIMPSGENHFYVDQPWNYTNYGEFIGVELPEISRRMFPISRKREDLGIAGLSMGCIHTSITAFTHPELFDYVGLFSGFLHDFIQGNELMDMIPREKSKDEHLKILDDAEAFRKDFKVFFRAMGKDDIFRQMFLDDDALLKEKGISCIRITYEGGHEWNVWRRCIRDFAKLLFR